MAGCGLAVIGTVLISFFAPEPHEHLNLDELLTCVLFVAAAELLLICAASYAPTGWALKSADARMLHTDSTAEHCRLHDVTVSSAM